MTPYRWLFWLWCAFPVLQGEGQVGWRWRWMQKLYDVCLALDGKPLSPTERRRKVS